MSENSDDLPSRSPVSRIALDGIFWSLVANWGSRFSNFILFVILARFLTPDEYGIVAVAGTVLMFISLISEFGMGDALVQRQRLQPADVNLPFYVSTIFSIFLCVSGVITAPLLEQWLNVPGLAAVVPWLCALAPLSSITIFQESMYRREFKFRTLALRALVANLIAGPVAITAAYLGAGLWSLVILNYLTVVVSMAWLWASPLWWPSLAFNVISLREIARFGLSVASMRVLDFLTLRLIDYIILDRFGVAALGLYTVGARLYQVLMQLLQGALNNVSLSVLSKISDERERIAAIYLRAISISGVIGAPVFVFCSAASPELCLLLFGTRWAGVAAMSAPLLLLGALQCVQYLNGQYLTARGKPSIVLAIALVKCAFTIIGLLFVPAVDVRNLIICFCIFQLVATPLSFWAVFRDLKIPPVQFTKTILSIIICNAAGYFTVVLARPHVTDLIPAAAGGIGVLTALCIAFIIGFGLVLLTVGRNELTVVSNFLKNAIAFRNPSTRAE